jgi:lysophospholipase L1-like esterase
LDLRTKQFNGVIGGLKAVKNDRVELVDLYGKTVSMSRKKSSYYSSDLFHPSAEGYIQWNNIINAD